MGWDIGGANTKYCALNDNTIDCKIKSFELWRTTKEIQKFVSETHKKFSNKYNIINAISMSGETCDIFPTRDLGVKKILSFFNNQRSDNYVFSKNEKFIKINKNISSGLIASMNWLAAATYLKSYNKNIIGIDLGSTTTDILLIKDNQIINKRKNDFTGLTSSELMYTGCLRTPISAIVNKIKIRNKVYNIIPENFASIADIYNVLSVILSKNNYTNSSDNRPKTYYYSMRRLSRIFGFDYSKPYENTILSLSKKIMSIHLSQIDYIINYHIKDKYPKIKGLKIIGMGVGRELIRIISKKNKWDYQDFMDYVDIKKKKGIIDVSDVVPAFALSHLIKNEYDETKKNRL